MTTQKVCIVILLAIVSMHSIIAGARPGQNELPSPQYPLSEYTLGTEIDALPFLTGGYHFSVIGGMDRFRLRAIVSQVTLPRFVFDSSHFGASSLHVSALVVDYFFAPKNHGFWVGGGFENWTGAIDGKISGTSGSYQEWISTLGAGDNWFFYQNFYLNPWIAAHL